MRRLTDRPHRPQVDPNVEMVCLAFTRGRLSLDGDKTKDPMETMTVLRATALVDTDEDAMRSLAFMDGCPRLEFAEVAVHKVQTSMAQEYGERECHLWNGPVLMILSTAQQLADNPSDGRYFIDNTWLQGDAEAVTDSLYEAFTTLPSKDSFFLYYSMAPLRPLADMAFDIQTEHYTAGYIIARGEDVSLGVVGA
jgi:hypothetical protein